MEFHDARPPALNFFHRDQVLDLKDHAARAGVIRLGNGAVELFEAQRDDRSLPIFQAADRALYERYLEFLASAAVAFAIAVFPLNPRSLPRTEPRAFAICPRCEAGLLSAFTQLLGLLEP